MKKTHITSILTLLVILVLMLTLRGLPGTPSADELLEYKNNPISPLELSPDRARYSLIYAIVEDRTFDLSLPLARFATPDVAFLNGEYVSLFAPGASILAVPGYMIGSLLGSALLGVFGLIAGFAFLNLIMIKQISMRLGSSTSAAFIGGFAFLFATPAFPYAMTLFQHHISVFLILAGILLIISFKSWPSRVLIWMLIGFSFTVDYPNAIMMLPIALYLIAEVVGLKKDKGSLAVSIDARGLAASIFVLIPFLLLAYHNILAYGNPTQLSGTLMSVDNITNDGSPETLATAGDKEVNIFEEEADIGSAGSFFDTRNIINGFYIHLMSPDRGVLFYAPVILFSIIGVFYLNKDNPKITTLLGSIASLNILLYSMWGDPWGGWAFGSRYLIPTYAIAGILLSIAISRLRMHTLFVFLFIPALIYSMTVNTLGALTTIQIPPQVQILQLEEESGREEKYTFMRSLDYLVENGTRSFLYNHTVSKMITPTQYYIMVLGVLVFIFLIAFNNEVDSATVHKKTWKRK